MAEITIGEMQLVSDGNTLTIARRDQPDFAVCLDADGFRELLDFVTTIAGTEFNQRQTFRIPLWDSSGLSVQIRTDESQVSVKPTNISLTGIFVEVHPDDWLDLQQDADVEVTLEFEGETQTHHAIVRRREGNGYGLFFPESMKGEEIDPPPGITRIVMELQRRWMARRARRAEQSI